MLPSFVFFVFLQRVGIPDLNFCTFSREDRADQPTGAVEVATHLASKVWYRSGGGTYSRAAPFSFPRENIEMGTHSFAKAASFPVARAYFTPGGTLWKIDVKEWTFATVDATDVDPALNIGSNNPAEGALPFATFEGCWDSCC
jgi:hypothetical protein